MGVKLIGIDYVEYAVKSAAEWLPRFEKWGFKKMNEQDHDGVRSSLLMQGKIRLVLSQGQSPQSYASRYVEKHGDGICDVAFEVPSVEQVYETVLSRGAKSAMAPKTSPLGQGTYSKAQVKAAGDVVHSLVARKNTTLFSPELAADTKNVHTGHGMFAVDHMTCNVEAGKMEEWASFYERVFEFKNTRFFHITTGRTGLISKVMENAEGTVKIPFNEPTEKESQIQEYLDLHKGPGIQHLALTTGDIIKTLIDLKKQGQEFLEVPDTYYDEVPVRIKGLKEDLNELKKNRILADGDQTGYLLQIFSKNFMGPFFFEVIQRAGNQGFGEGNFKALFEAIERDQALRGVL